jgi:hypothetical protein
MFSSSARYCLGNDNVVGGIVGAMGPLGSVLLHPLLFGMVGDNQCKTEGIRERGSPKLDAAMLFSSI